MKRFFKGLLAVVGVLVLAVGGVTLWFLGRTGAFSELKPHFAGTCEALPLPGSGEDIQVDRERGFAYVSELDRQAVIRGNPTDGVIVRIDLNEHPLTPRPALVSRPVHFQPHGLSLYIAPDGQRHLFVINHPNRRGVEPESVEHFIESGAGSFNHVETFQSPLMLSPNDLVAVGPRQVYVANDKAVGGGMKAALQQAGAGASPLLWFDGPTARVVVPDIASGGGINASADHRFIYVSETSGRRLRVLERTGEGGDLVERSRIALNTSPDNIDVADDGSVWVAGHANALALIKHFINGAPAPSQVWRVVLDGNQHASSIEEIYLDDGRTISAGSVGATYGRTLLVGSITAPKIMVCQRS